MSDSTSNTHGDVMRPPSAVEATKPCGCVGVGHTRECARGASKPDESCTRCGATPETGQTDGCPECEGIVGPIAGAPKPEPPDIECNAFPPERDEPGWKSKPEPYVPCEHRHPEGDESKPEPHPEAHRIRKVLRVHSGEDFDGSEFPTLEDGKAAAEELDVLVGRLEQLEEAIASALTSLGTGPAKDGYAYAVLSEALGVPPPE